MNQSVPNPLPIATPIGSGGGGIASGSSSARQSPTSARDSILGHKRNRSFAAFTEGSPGSEADYDEGEGPEARRKLVVKRACNDCRQQKLRCNVVQDPFQSCDRCVRLKLQCKIESNFKRVGKRNKHAEMERELHELRAKVAAQSSQPIKHDGVSYGQESNEAVASLLDLRQGNDKRNGSNAGYRTLGSVRLAPITVLELFENFWIFCHPWLPILDPSKPPDHYFNLSELLFWSIVCVSARRFPKDSPLIADLCPAMSDLIWARIGRVPQSYHIVKAMCLLCTWPLPTSSTSTDPTLMVAGVMMSVAMHFGLHRPSHAQDFSKFRVELREENLIDRVKVWAACNIVAQNVSTGYGQPSFTLYDWTLANDPNKERGFHISRELQVRLEIGKFCDRVTKTLYSTKTDPLGLLADDQRLPAINLLSRELEELILQFQQDASRIDLLHLRAAALHLRVSAFFDSPSHQDYRNDLMNLFFATRSYLEDLFALEPMVQSYATSYILQITLVAGFTLLKLFNSFFSSFVDQDAGRQLFGQTIRAIRQISVQTNDLPSRLAEVLSQMWRGSPAGGHGMKTSNPQRRANNSAPVDGSLKLKVRCRMSMSLVFDSVWRWREEYQAQGRINLDSAVKNPTHPDSATESSASSIIDPPLQLNQIPGGMMPLAGGNMNPMQAFVSNTSFETDNEVWDPLSWGLDGLVDIFPVPMSSVDGGLGANIL